ncbi:UDP-N-acetylmuramate dehydrogenase [Bacillaceae bacterium]
MQSVIEELKQADVGKILLHEPLANHTTWRVGGPADLLIEPKDKAGLIRGFQIIRKHHLPWRTIGRGSNLLVRDGGIRGVVFKLAEGLSDLHFDGETVRVGGGYSFIRLAVMAGKEGLTGLEFAGGIPGTVGGAVYMNAGAHGSDVSRILKSAEILFANGELVTLSNEEMEFGYRSSILQKRKGIVTEATFQLAYGDRKAIAAAMAAFKDRRRKTQPLQLPCAGSVFRNPEGDHAGRLIELAGLKGYRVGDAKVSEIHANFIVNCGRASARDVLTLMDHIIERVREKFGVTLVPEVQVVGEG